MRPANWHKPISSAGRLFGVQLETPMPAEMRTAAFDLANSLIAVYHILKQQPTWWQLRKVLQSSFICVYQNLILYKGGKKTSVRAMIIILQCLSTIITQTIYPSIWSVKRLQGGGRPPCPCFNGGGRRGRACLAPLFHFLHSQVWAARVQVITVARARASKMSHGPPGGVI